VEIRVAAEEGWPSIYPCYSMIMNEGRTYAFPESQTLEEAGLVGLHVMYRRL